MCTRPFLTLALPPYVSPFCRARSTPRTMTKTTPHIFMRRNTLLLLASSRRRRRRRIRSRNRQQRSRECPESISPNKIFPCEDTANDTGPEK